MAKDDLYDTIAEYYDLLISWQQRLRRERPFFRKLFKEFGVRRILDAATGTGMHAAAFHKWGFHVVGADINLAMLETARQNTAGLGIQFVHAGFSDIGNLDGMFDAITCLGNSLPHVPSLSGLENVLTAMFTALLPGGILIIHNHNYDRILAMRERFLPLIHRRHKGRDYLFIRFFDFAEDSLVFNVACISKEVGEWCMVSSSATHLPITSRLLTTSLLRIGFSEIRLYGSYRFEPFEEFSSEDLIAVAQKPGPPPIKSEAIAHLYRIPIKENGEPLVDIARAASEIGVRQKPTFVRTTVFNMLRDAQSRLPVGYRIRVTTGFRDLAHQRKLYEDYYWKLAEAHPEWPSSRLRREVNRFLAPPDAKHPPGHTTGGAVDVELLGPDGNMLDMTSTIVPVESPACIFPTYSKLITPQAAKNRQILVDAMSGAGFSNYPGEWWHWSYGDDAWAVRTGASFAFYGAVSPST